MNEEQNTPEKASDAAEDTSKVFLGDAAMQSKQEFDNDKVNEKDHYYDVDNPKKGGITDIGDGEMRNEGLVGSGNLPDDDPLTSDRHTTDGAPI